MDATPSLRTIPLIDVGADGPVALLDTGRERLEDLMIAGRQHYGPLLLRQGDRATRRWLTRNDNPYRHEIAEIAAQVVRPGAYLLNLSYEWSCTTGIGPDPGQPGSRMLRTLDWPLGGLGRTAVVARQDGEAGPYFNVTWPGFVGVITAMAPGRFSAAINQPPARRYTGSCWFDWAIERVGVWRRSGLPPSHLLRRVFDRCRTYAEAREMIEDAPLPVPAFFTLSGNKPDEGCVIERTEHAAAVIEAPASVSNHWRRLRQFGRLRGHDTVGRLALMERTRDGAGDNFDWVIPPILNGATRLGVIANAAAGTLTVRGWEAERPATEVFTL